MGAVEDAYEANANTAFADLAGVELQHDLNLAIEKWTDWSAIAERVSALGAEVHALQLARADGGFSVRCRLKRVSADAARALTYSLLDEGVAVRGSVEHLVLTARAAR
jgi:hypothetical protein